MEVRDVAEPLPVEWCVGLGLPDGASYAAGADVCSQGDGRRDAQPWPYDFPRKVE